MDARHALFVPQTERWGEKLKKLAAPIGHRCRPGKSRFDYRLSSSLDMPNSNCLASSISVNVGGSRRESIILFIRYPHAYSTPAPKRNSNQVSRTKSAVFQLPLRNASTPDHPATRVDAIIDRLVRVLSHRKPYCPSGVSGRRIFCYFERFLPRLPPLGRLRRTTLFSSTLSKRLRGTFSERGPRPNSEAIGASSRKTVSVWP